MKSRGRTWSIGAVAEKLGLETHVLRHWESMGLVEPARDSAGRRCYGRDDLVRIATVVRSKEAGLSLEQIRVLLTSDSHGRHLVLEGHLAELDRRIAEIRLARAMAEHAFNCRAHDIAECPRFRAHVADIVAAFEGPARAEVATT